MLLNVDRRASPSVKEGMAVGAAGLLLAALMMSWVAIYNKAALVFSDTLTYAMSAYQREMPGLFSVFYSVYILPLHQGVTFWPVVFAQGAMLAHILYLTARSVLPRPPGAITLVVIIAALCVFSSVPWITGQILPDVFTSVLLLGMFLLAFCSDDLSRWELRYVTALTTASITTHFSHVPIAAGLALLCIILQPVFASKRLPFSRLAARLILPCALAVALMLAANWLSSGQVALARNSNVFLLAKWIDDGPALSYLRQACDSESYALCAHLEDLEGSSHDKLKWDENSAFRKVGTFDQLEPEARKIVAATLALHPVWILERAVRDSAAQLLRFRAGDGLSPAFAKLVGYHLGALFGPQVGEVFSRSRQAEGQLPIAGARRLHLIGLALGFASCLVTLLVCGANLRRQVAAFYAVVVAGIIWNAVVTGGLSGAYDRYLARVIWLVCFAGILGAVTWGPRLADASRMIPAGPLVPRFFRRRFRAPED